MPGGQEGVCARDVESGIKWFAAFIISRKNSCSMC